MRSFKSVIGGMFLLSLCSIQGAFAGVLTWASDNRSGQPVRAEQAEWLRYLQAQSQANNPLITPAQAGVSQEYSLHLKPQADLGALMTSRLATGSDAALWIQLNLQGLEWVLEQGGQAQTLRTPATSKGLSLGLNWMNMQLSMSAPTATAPTLESSVEPIVPVTPMPSASAINLPESGSGLQGQVSSYQASGNRVRVSGILDASDFLRLTQGLRLLEGIDTVYPASISGTEVELVIASESLLPNQVLSLVGQQPWLRRTEQGDLRWDALALPLPGGISNANSAAELESNSAAAASFGTESAQVPPTPERVPTE